VGGGVMDFSLFTRSDGGRSVVIHASGPGPAYEPPPVVRTRLDFDVGESVSEIFQQLGEWTANELERQSLEGAA